MKRVEVKLSLPVVAPLLDVIKSAGDSLDHQLAAPLAMEDLEGDFRDTWTGELLAGQNEDVRTLLALFDSDFFSTGVIGFDEENAETGVGEGSDDLAEALGLVAVKSGGGLIE